MKQPPHQARTYPRHNPQQGIALLAVLWLVVALSIMLAALQKVVRGEIKMASQSRNTVQNSAIADAAIRLTLQEIYLNKTTTFSKITTKTFPVLGQDITLEIIPANGYLDLNSAPASLLANAFEYGGASKDQAQQLAKLTLEARLRKTDNGETAKLHATEELLQIEGFTYRLYQKLRQLITADITSPGLINPMAAPLGTLTILTEGDPTRAQQLQTAQRTNPDTMDRTALNTAQTTMTSTSFIHLRATSTLPDKTQLIRAWLVDTATPAYGLPWRVIRTDQSTARANQAIAP